MSATTSNTRVNHGKLDALIFLRVTYAQGMKRERALTVSARRRFIAGLTANLLVCLLIAQPGHSATALDVPALPGAPTDIVFSANGSVAYTANGTANSVSAIDTATLGVLRTYPVEGRADIIALSPNGRELAVGTARQVTFINVATGAQTIVGLGPFADGIVYAPDGSGVWVSAATYSPRWITLPNHIFQSSLAVSDRSAGLSRNPADGRLWVSTDNRFIEIDGQSGLETRGLSIDYPQSGIAFIPSNERVFAPPWQSQYGAVALDLAHPLSFTPSFVPRNDAVESRRTLDLVTSRDGTRVFGRTSGDSIVVIDPAVERELSDIVVGADQTAIAVHPTTGHIWTGHDNPARIVITPEPEPTVVRPAVDVTVSRIGGATRFETAVNVSIAAFPDNDSAESLAPIAYLATGASYPDALSAAPAAIKNGGPLLLTGATLPTVTRNELLRLNPARVVLVGGTGAVSRSVEADVRAILPTARVDRVSGSDRYSTSIALINDAWQPGTASRVFIATGRNFPDALSAAPVAGAGGNPVLLVNGMDVPNGPEGSLSTAAEGLISGLGADGVILLGGTGSVGYRTWIEATSDAAGPLDRRLWGSNRYSTSRHINGVSIASADTVYLASGLTFPDALAGSVLAGLGGNPLFIVPPACVPQGVIDDISRLGASRVVLLGGTGALSPSVQELTPCR
ncbi:MAG: hypothetical protein C0444_05945 [Microbacterium sp.]|nr:hypothetical protein [Microbacterium sp.]MBA4345008.1 hypothetical protein [Microbacterium sp.]